MDDQSTFKFTDADSEHDSDFGSDYDSDSDSDSDCGSTHSAPPVLTSPSPPVLPSSPPPVPPSSPQQETTYWSIVVAMTHSGMKFVSINPMLAPHTKQASSTPLVPMDFMFGDAFDPIFKRDEIKDLEDQITELPDSDDKFRSGQIHAKLCRLRSRLPPPPNKVWNDREREYELSCTRSLSDTSGASIQHGLWSKRAFDIATIS